MKKVPFIRLTVLVGCCQENADVVTKIATFAEGQMPLIKGFKLIKCSEEHVHSLETYSSPCPAVPRPRRQDEPSKQQPTQT